MTMGRTSASLDDDIGSSSAAKPSSANKRDELMAAMDNGTLVQTQDGLSWIRAAQPGMVAKWIPGDALGRWYGQQEMCVKQPVARLSRTQSSGMGRSRCRWIGLQEPRRVSTRPAMFGDDRPGLNGRRRTASEITGQRHCSVSDVEPDQVIRYSTAVKMAVFSNWVN